MTDETPDEATTPTEDAPPAEWTTRNSFRAGVIARVAEGLLAHQQTIESGPLEGLEVVSAGHIAEVLGAELREPLPPYSLTTAEVATPAIIAATAFCPRCGQPAAMLASLTSQLVVEAGGGELRLKSHTKAVSHVCGQLPLPVGESEGQTSFELADITGPACPFPGCTLREEHEGDHDVPSHDPLDDDPPSTEPASDAG